MLKWLDTLDKNGEPKTVATPSQARMIFHRVMDQIKKVVSNTQNMQYLKQAIFDPMPELKIAQLPELSEAELPVISMQSQLPHAAAKPPSLALFFCERLSASMARSLHLSLSLFTTSRLAPWTRGESNRG